MGIDEAREHERVAEVERSSGEVSAQVAPWAGAVDAANGDDDGGVLNGRT
jgi:hypothetical protein